MLDRLLDWLLPLVVVAAGLFLVRLVWDQLKEKEPSSVATRSEPLDLSGIPPKESPAMPTGRYHSHPRLCGPAPAVEAQRSIYSWRDESGTLNLSDRPPADSEFRETAIAVDWAEGSFKLNLSVHHSAAGKLPLSFDSRLRSDAHAIIRSLARISGQKKLVPVQVSLTVYGTKAEYDRGTRFARFGSSGVYSKASGDAAMYLQKNEQTTLRVARHEVTHALNCNLFGVIPPWLNEGLAGYFEGIDVRDAVARVRAFPATLDVAKAHARRGDQGLVAMLHSDGDTFWNARDNTYPLSASLMFFFMDSSDKQDVLGRYLGTLAVRQERTRNMMPSTQDFLAYLDRVYHSGSRGAWAEWQVWVRNRRDVEHTWRW